MLWEVERGRSCDSLRVAQANLIRSQGLELISTGKELELAKAGSIMRDSLVITAIKGQEILTQQFQKDLSKQKRKTKRWRTIGIIQGVLIVVIVLTP